MAKRLRTFLVLLSCLHLCAGVDAMLQIVAWSRMLVDYSAQAGLAEGASMTFDGKHPCRMCQALAESRKRQAEEKKEPPDTSPLKRISNEFVAPAISEAPTPYVVEFPIIDFLPQAAGSSLYAKTPPVPPPRGLRA